jgi:hypothetical protein
VPATPSAVGVTDLIMRALATSLRQIILILGVPVARLERLTRVRAKRGPMTGSGVIRRSSGDKEVGCRLRPSALLDGRNMINQAAC